jgi:hypothetical protein
MVLRLRQAADGRLVTLSGAALSLERPAPGPGGVPDPLVELRVRFLEALLERLAGRPAPDGPDRLEPRLEAENVGRPATADAEGGPAGGQIRVQVGAVLVEPDAEDGPPLEAPADDQPGWRYLALCAAYAQTWYVSAVALESAGVALEVLRERTRQVAEAGLPAGPLSPAAARLRAALWRALLDDLDTPDALAVVWQIARADLPAAERRLLLLEADALFDLGLAEAATPVEEALPAGAEALIEQRAAAREARNWAQSDALRDQLSALGVESQDGPAGSVYRRR